MLYQRKTLPFENWGFPAELPADVAALGLTDAQLADMTAALGQQAADMGYGGQAFFPRPNPPPEVPQEISRLQGKMALFAAGLLGSVNAMIASADMPTQIYFNDADMWHRDHPALLGLSAALGLTGAQVDALFISAAALN
jgi:hypothetical protein